MLPNVSLQLCLTVFRLDLVRKEQCTSRCTKITPVPLLSERTKRQDGCFEPHTHGKALEVFMLLEVCMSPVVLLRHVGVELHLLCVLDTRLDMRDAVHHCQEANTLHQLVSNP